MQSSIKEMYNVIQMNLTLTEQKENMTKTINELKERVSELESKIEQCNISDKVRNELRLDIIYKEIEDPKDFGYLVNKYIAGMDLRLSRGESGNCDSHCGGQYTWGNHRCNCGNRRVNVIVHFYDDVLQVDCEAY